MTVRLSITSFDKSKNEQRTYIRYLGWNESFIVVFQEIDRDAPQGAIPQTHDACLIKYTQESEVVVQNLSGDTIVLNGQEIQHGTMKRDDKKEKDVENTLILPHSITLSFKIYEVTGAPAGPKPKGPILIDIIKKEKPKDKVADYNNPVGHEIDGYYFQDILSYGNMGIVYKGLQKSLNRVVAIKTVSPKNMNNPVLIKRFMNMAKLAWRLNHPYIVQIYDTGMSQEFKINYVVMEHIEGETLRSLLDREKKLSVELSCKIISQLASALSFAHRQNIIHRDVNPSNIIMTKNDYIKLVGLALSKVIDPNEERINLTMKGAAMGTMGYISPEQAADASSVDFRTDIYSMGVIFYECLCGKSPYDPALLKDPKKYAKALQQIPKHPPHTINPNVSETLSNIVMKCLMPSLDKRYQKAEDVLNDIKVYSESAALSTAQKRIRAMFPKTPEIPGFEFCVVFEPMEEIGGDFYDFVSLPDGKLGITIGDVTGHGIEAAVVMGMVKSVVKVMAKHFDSAAAVLEEANKNLSPDMDSTTFTTVAYGILDTKKKTLRYGRAGHNPMILYNPTRNPSLVTYAPKGAILGVPWALNAEDADIALKPGDLIVQYTDGITEAKSKEGEEFGLERLCEVITQEGSGSAAKIVKAIKDNVANFSKGTSSKDADDVTLVVIKVKDED